MRSDGGRQRRSADAGPGTRHETRALCRRGHPWINLAAALPAVLLWCLPAFEHKGPLRNGRTRLRWDDLAARYIIDRPVT